MSKVMKSSLANLALSIAAISSGGFPIFRAVLTIQQQHI